MTHSEVYDATDHVVVPEIYGGAHRLNWYFGAEFPFSSDSRDSVWEDILDAGEVCPEHVPRRLIDAWDNTKRSREYLNGIMDKFDLDNLYYSHAYGEEHDHQTVASS